MKKITVYSKPNCMQCNFTKKFLDEHKIAYTAYDVQEDQSALARVQELGFQSLPVIEIDGEDAFFGFRPDKLEQLA
ncbi:glutaredoxin-like protein NrdH [Vaginisenegalia massiliensis]|uniref:glutaredoxin-like protein NrdH n=1 Tax=Vaginisenegalia massiliensis TaxID=2058294 RepID=UPI000F524CE4|nr:glutaredoxin-like protein NrdH [Vaginisenegalia massiliensis]